MVPERSRYGELHELSPGMDLWGLDLSICLRNSGLTVRFVVEGSVWWAKVGANVRHSQCRDADGGCIDTGIAAVT